MDPGHIFKIITNSTLLATRLLPSIKEGFLAFGESRYCAVLSEDTPLSTKVAKVSATHQKGLTVHYRISGGNRDGLFTIDRRTGSISLAAHLDYERHKKHVLELSAEAGSDRTTASLLILVADVNDNPPIFDDNFKTEITIIEEDDRNLPRVITKVMAKDPDLVDEGALEYSIEGEGVGRNIEEGPIFSIHPTTGEVFQLTGVNRDPPDGRSIYKVKVKVTDGKKSQVEHEETNKSQGREKRKVVWDEVYGRTKIQKSQNIWLEKHKNKVTHDAIKLKRHPKINDKGLANSSLPSEIKSQKIKSFNRKSSRWKMAKKKPVLKIQTRKENERSKLSLVSLLRGRHHDKCVTSPSVSSEDGSNRTNRSDAITEKSWSPSKSGVMTRLDSSSTAHLLRGERFFHSGVVNKHWIEKGEKGITSDWEETDERINIEIQKENSIEKRKEKLVKEISKKVQSHWKRRSKFHRVKRMQRKKTVDWARKVKLIQCESILHQLNLPIFFLSNDEIFLNNEEQCKQVITDTISKASQYIINKWKTILELIQRCHQSKHTEFRPLKSPVLQRKTLIMKFSSDESQWISVCDDKSLKFLSSSRDLKQYVCCLNLCIHNAAMSNEYVNALSDCCADPALSIFESFRFEEMICYCLSCGIKSINDYTLYLIPLRNENNHTLINEVTIKHIFGGISTKQTKYTNYYEQSNSLNENKVSRYTSTGRAQPHVHKLNNDLKHLNTLLVPETDYATSLPPFYSATKSDNKTSLMSAGKRLCRNDVQNCILQKDFPMKSKVRKTYFSNFSRASSRKLKKSRNPRQILRHEEFGVLKNYFCVVINPEIEIRQRVQTQNSQDSEMIEDNNFDPLTSHIFLTTTSQHASEIVLTIYVKDINDNAPVFPNTTMYGKVQENGPVDLPITTVTAWDSDDATSGTNAKLAYSLEKNVIDEKTGEVLFTIHPETGELRTAVCCLDRETTPEYRIQVVASDGGGLKGSGTVIVRLTDVNDNTPRLSREQWDVLVTETPAMEPLQEEVLAEISVTDPDTTNYFLYRIVEDSGLGWDHFTIRTAKGIGELLAIKPLDYESELHRKGFRFQVQVTDRGPGGWSDLRHVDTAFINITLVDVNDNPPVFERESLHITVDEDIPIDTLLATMSATDADQSLSGEIDYHLHDELDSLRIDGNGSIQVWRHLDREGVEGETSVAHVIAVDRGNPKRSTTATLTITLRDVNDCPPRLLPPHILHVSENGPPQKIGELRATDDDVWIQGHGPPFHFSFAAANRNNVREKIDLKFDPDLDSGRGGANIWTKKPLDRETNRSLSLYVQLSDSQGLKTIQIVTIIIDDVNDNVMKPGEKIVYLWRTRDTGSKTELGRIFVEDPDDWDLMDKSFEWLDTPHPLFSLNRESGRLFAVGEILEGRYDLKFGVSDSKWGQQSVKANVTVMVQVLSEDALSYAVPIHLSPVSPSQLTKGWTPSHGGGTLGSLVDAITDVAEETKGEVMIVSIFGIKDVEKDFWRSSVSLDLEERVTCVWVSYREKEGIFMNPIKLSGVLEMNIYKIRQKINLYISLHHFDNDFYQKTLPYIEHAASSYSSSMNILPDDPNSMGIFNNTFSFNLSSAPSTSLAAIAMPLQVVDNNSTSFVTPRLSRPMVCLIQNKDFLKPYTECPPLICLNGGKCLLSVEGNKCVCPGGTVEPYCKISSRSFEAGGWAWIKPFSLCMPEQISFRFLTTSSNGMILYFGPLTSEQSNFSSKRQSSPKHIKIQTYSGTTKSNTEKSLFSFDKRSDSIKKTHLKGQTTPLLTIFLQDGYPHLVIEGKGEPIHLQVNTSEPLSNGKWHQVHILHHNDRIKMMVDYCAFGWSQTTTELSHCIDSHYWYTASDRRPLLGRTGPLQVGGLAHETPKAYDHGWSTQPIGSSLEGCIDDLRIERELIDLGNPAHSYKSYSGCELQQRSCIPACKGRSQCKRGLIDGSSCECPAGLSGVTCEEESHSITLLEQSYFKVAFSFSLDSLVLPLQFRLRTRSTDAIVLHLSSQSHKEILTISIENGNPCLAINIRKRRKMINLQETTNQNSHKNRSSSLEAMTISASVLPKHKVCVTSFRINDGSWHIVKGGKFGSTLVLEIDGGDFMKRNESVIDSMSEKMQPHYFKLDLREGLSVGGIPHFKNGALKRVENDLLESCISDLRIYGKPVPLPLVMNETKWGQVTTFQNIESNCVAPDSCLTMKCKHPLVCSDEWRKAICRCPPGEQITMTGCQKVDMCLFGPCLNGGSCTQNRNGMSCLCRPWNTGKHCEWNVAHTDVKEAFSPILLAFLISSLVLVGFLLIVFGVKFCSFLKNRRHKRKKKTPQASMSSGSSSEDNLEIFYIYDQKGRKRKSKSKSRPHTSINTNTKLVRENIHETEE